MRSAISRSTTLASVCGCALAALVGCSGDPAPPPQPQPTPAGPATALHWFIPDGMRAETVAGERWDQPAGEPPGNEPPGMDP